MPCIQAPTPFSQSLIWQFQREYFNSEGVNAWRTGEVPHYITSNPVMGKTYAELVLALLRDLALKGNTTDTVYLLELGAGHGRLCYHFFKHFEYYYQNSAIPLPPFCYILSDFTQANLDFWQNHPRLQPYFDKGWLDYCLYDVESTTQLNLHYSHKQIDINSLAQPIIAVGNYFFDSIPQDVFKVENGTLSHTLLSLHSDDDTSQEGSAAQKAAKHEQTENLTEKAIEQLDSVQVDSVELENIQLAYSYQPIQGNQTISDSQPISDIQSAYAQEPDLNHLLETYRKSLSHSHVLFPHIGLRCLARLQSLSQQGLVLLTADKGEHHLSNLDHNPAPGLVTHGSFSLTVNYHALQQACTDQGGLALFPLHQQASLDLGCLLFLDNASSYLETINSYQRFVSDYGPDDYFSLKKLAEPNFASASYRDIIAVTRLSGYDARIFMQMLPRLFDLVTSLTSNERWNLLLLIPKLWDTYYPLAEADDFACAMGDLLMALEFFREAVLYFDKSLSIYGQDNDTATTLYKIALCQCLSGDFAEAAPLLQHLKTELPSDKTLQALIEAFNDELSLI